MSDRGESPAATDVPRRVGPSRGVVLVLLAVSAAVGFAASNNAASGLALLSLAALPAMFAVPPKGRVALGALVVFVAALVSASAALSDDVLAWASAAALMGAGVVLAWRGRSWPSWGSRYTTASASAVRGPRDEPSNEPGDEPRDEPVDLWRALDRGEDPTASKDSPEPRAR
jgi:hypothetical protein